MSLNIIKNFIVLSIVFYIDKYRIEFGSINGFIFGFGIIELISHSFVYSIFIFILGLILFFTSWRCFITKDRMNHVPAQNN